MLRAGVNVDVWATPASNVNERKFTDAVLELGPAKWARYHLVPKLAAHKKRIRRVWIAYPGGHEPGDADFRFDMVTQCLRSADPRVQACGDYAAWGEAAIEIRAAIDCQVGMYVGTAALMTRPNVIHECEEMLKWWGAEDVDAICIDTLSSRNIGDPDALAAGRLAAAGVHVCGETRPNYRFMQLPTEYMCFKSKWDRQGGYAGDRDHVHYDIVRKLGGSVVLIDDANMTIADIEECHELGLITCVAVDRLPTLGVSANG